LKKGLKARDAIFFSNQGFVLKKVRNYHDWDGDYIQEGFFGLLLASENFKSEFQYRFTTYADSWIKMCLAQHYYYRSNSLKISGYYRSLHSKARKMREKNPHISQEEILAKLKIPSSTLTKIEKFPLEISLNEKVNRRAENDQEKLVLIEDTSTNYIEELMTDFENLTLPKSLILISKLGLDTIFNKIKEGVPISQLEEKMINDFCKKLEKSNGI